MHLFSNIQFEIISAIKNAKSNLKIAVTWFTNHEIFNEILEKLENPKFKVELIVLNDRINNKKEGLNFQKFIELNGNFYFSSNENMVHHKICIVDNSTLITGSYNWTYYAENRNWENVVFIEKKEIVDGYIAEFDKIIRYHNKVENIEKEQKTKAVISSNDYLCMDYTLQAKIQEKKGNDLAVAKIYTEILKINSKQKEIVKARNEIVKKYNNEILKVSPFEIGIRFKNGYSSVIPAYENLPYTAKKVGLTTTNYAKSLLITIQKNDYIPRTIKQFSLTCLKPSPKGTKKVEFTLTLEQNGILTIYCQELNGFGRTKTEKVNIKKWAQKHA